MCGIIGYVGDRACKTLLLQGLERLEYRGYDSAGIALIEERRARLRPCGRQPADAEARDRAEALALHHRSRPHALGDARRSLHGERAPAHRLRRRRDVDRPERDRRELPGAQGIAPPRRPHLHVGDGRRGGRPPDRAALRRGSRRRRPPRLRAARGALLLRRHPPRPRGDARRRALPDAARRRGRRGRDVPRLLDRRVPLGDATRAVHRRPPGRRAAAGRRGLPLPGRRRWSSRR